MKRKYNWKKDFEGWKKYNLPFPPKIKIIPESQTPHEKKMAKIAKKLINYLYIEAWGSKILETPWGILMWKPKTK